MKIIKTKSTVLIITCLIALLCVGIKSDAFFTSADKVENNFSIGNYTIVTKENFNPKNKDFGDSIKKEVYVENTGTEPAYVRVKVVPFWKTGMPMEIEGKNTVSMEYEKSSNWVKIGDFYYYKKVLNPKEKTDILLKTVRINKFNDKEVVKAVQDKYKIQDLAIDVFTESIIKDDNNSLNEGRLEDNWGIKEKDFIN